MVPEKRSAPRVLTDIIIEIYDETGRHIIGIGAITDLGVNCAGFDSTLTLVPFKKVYLRFMLERTCLLGAVAEVRRVAPRERKRHYGVRFEHIDVMHKEELRQFIDGKTKSA